MRLRQLLLGRVHRLEAMQHLRPGDLFLSCMLLPSRHHMPSMPARILLRRRMDHAHRMHAAVSARILRNHPVHAQNRSRVHGLRAELGLLPQRQKPLQVLIVRPRHVRNDPVPHHSRSPVRGVRRVFLLPGIKHPPNPVHNLRSRGLRDLNVQTHGRQGLRNMLSKGVLLQRINSPDRLRNRNLRK